MGQSQSGKTTVSLILKGLIPSGRGRTALFTLILLAALALRLFGFSWGLPEDHFVLSLYETETETFEYIQKINLGSGDLDPDTHRPLIFNLIIGQAVLLTADWFGVCEFSTDMPFYHDLPGQLRRCFQVLRGWNIIVALSGLVLIFGIGKAVGGDNVGLLALALAAFTPVHITESHFYTHQIRICTYIAASLYLTIHAINSGRNTVAYLAAGVAGLSGAVLINGLFCWISIPLITWYTSPKGRSVLQRLISKKTFTLSALFFAVFALGINAQWKYSGSFLAQFINIPNVELWYRFPGQVGVIQSLFSTLPYALGIPFYIATVFGLGWALRQRRKTDIALLAFIAIFFFLLLIFTVARARYTLHILPMISAIAALFILEATQDLKRKVFVRIATIAGILVYSVFYSGALLGLLTQPANTKTASAWIERNIPPESKIGLVSTYRRGLPDILGESYFGTGKSRYRNLVNISEQYEYRLPENLDYVIIFDLECFGIYNKYLSHPVDFPTKSKLPRALISELNYKEIAQFVNRPAWHSKYILSNLRPLDLSFGLIPIRIYINKSLLADLLEPEAPDG